jgi:small-conductance mechanosensitive channel
LNPIEWINYELFGNTLLSWSGGATAFVVVWSILWIVRRLVYRRLNKLAEHRGIRALEIAAYVVRRTKGWFLFAVAVYAASQFVDISDKAHIWIDRATLILALLQAGAWLSAGFTRFLHSRRQQELEESPDGVAAMDILSFLSRVAIWTIVLLAILDNLGVNITTLIAGLGVGGIAVALAAQNILSDLFASLSIVLDKPFVVGDFLIMGEFLGTVERVGIKTTRLRSLSGEQLVFSNNDLLNSRIRNYGRMQERRVVFALGVTYQTSAETLKRIPDIIRKAVEAQADIRFDRAHFQKYGAFSLDFEVVYHVLSADYNQYMDIQQAINLQIFSNFEAEGIEFAYPTQTLYVNRPDRQDALGPSL